jgi:hypothetical protein
MPLVVSELCHRQSSKCKNEQRAITPKLGRQSYGSFALHFYLMTFIKLLNVLFISLIFLEFCPGQSSKCKNEQRAITPKLSKT